MQKTYDINPHEVEQLLTAYAMGKSMSVADSNAIGITLGILRRHADEYIERVARTLGVEVSKGI